MYKDRKIDFEAGNAITGFYACTQCGNILFEAGKKFDAGCGFPSFWNHREGGVQLNPLDTFGRHRIQLLCSRCGQHLGHLFDNKWTPSGLRYCINENAIRFVANERPDGA